MNHENTIRVGCDLNTRVPNEPYWYVAGPMTGYPKHNFPLFERVTGLLRAAGMVICPPHELEDQPLYERVMSGSTGHEADLSSQSPLGFELLRRDANIVMHPRCVGVVALPGWQDSFGAGQIEVYLASRFRKNTVAFVEDEDFTHGWALVDFDYDKTMTAHAVL